MSNLCLTCILSFFYPTDLRSGHLLRSELEGPPTAFPSEHDGGVPPVTRLLAQGHLATRRLLQERQVRHLPDHDNPQPLPLAQPRLYNSLHGEVSNNNVT